MAELPNAFEKPSSPAPEQVLSPVMRDLKARINDPVNFKLINDAYTASAEEEKALLTKLIEQNTANINDCVDSPDDMARLLNNIITESKNESRNQIKSTNIETKQKVTKEDKIETNDNKELLKERLKKADEQLVATYALFG